MIKKLYLLMVKIHPAQLAHVEHLAQTRNVALPEIVSRAIVCTGSLCERFIYDFVEMYNNGHLGTV